MTKDLAPTHGKSFLFERIEIPSRGHLDVPDPHFALEKKVSRAGYRMVDWKPAGEFSIIVRWELDTRK